MREREEGKRSPKRRSGIAKYLFYAIQTQEKLDRVHENGLATQLEKLLRHASLHAAAHAASQEDYAIALNRAFTERHLKS